MCCVYTIHTCVQFKWTVNTFRRQIKNTRLKSKSKSNTIYCDTISIVHTSNSSYWWVNTYIWRYNMASTGIHILLPHSITPEIFSRQFTCNINFLSPIKKVEEKNGKYVITTQWSCNQFCWKFFVGAINGDIIYTFVFTHTNEKKINNLLIHLHSMNFSN